MNNDIVCPQHVPGAVPGAAAAAGRLREAEARGGRQVRQAEGAHVSVPRAAAPAPREGRERPRQPKNDPQTGQLQRLHRLPKEGQTFRLRFRPRKGRGHRGKVALGNP